jgi:nucleotide-binding universal stress UspA family protein
MMFERILVPLDGSDLAEEVLPHVTALAVRFRSEVVLVLADQPAQIYLETAGAPGGVPVALPIADPTPFIEGERKAAEGYLEAVSERLRLAGANTRGERIEGAPVESILQLARRWPADLIAMTTHGRSGLRRVVYGSVAEAVLHGAPCPVLLVRVDRAPSAERSA